MRARYTRTSSVAVILPAASCSCRSPIVAFSTHMVPSAAAAPDSPTPTIRQKQSAGRGKRFAQSNSHDSVPIKSGLRKGGSCVMTKSRRSETIGSVRPWSRPGRSAPPASRGGWLLLGGAFAAFTASAAIMHSYTVFLVAFIEEFRGSRAETSIAYSASQLVAGASSPLVGALVDRLGPRRLLLLGGSLLLLRLLASAFISALWQIILLYGIVMTIGANCLGLVVFVPLLSRHFARRRGMAISIVQSANGFGRAASAPLVQLLISTVGWRGTYLVQAAFMAAIVPLLAALFRRAARYPVAAEPDQAPDGSAPTALPSPEWSL